MLSPGREHVCHSWVPVGGPADRRPVTCLMPATSSEQPAGPAWPSPRHTLPSLNKTTALFSSLIILSSKEGTEDREQGP